MKKSTILLLCFSFLLYGSVFAQRERNYVYLFDCTQSMQQLGIWDSAKTYLKDDIARLSPDATVTIIPFQGKVHPAIQFKPIKFNWDRVNNELDTYIPTRTNTNICAAWDEGLKHIDPNKDNYFFLLTDGNDNVNGMDAVCNRIRQWCGEFKHSYAFYVMLVNQARHKDLEAAVNYCKTVFLVDADGHIDPFGVFAQNRIPVNTLELDKITELPFSASGEYPVEVICEDPYFNVEAVSHIKDGKAEFKVSSQYSPQQLNQQLGQTYTFSFEVKGEGVKILNDTLRVDVTNKPERLLTMAGKEQDMGNASWYGAFLCKKEKKQDTLSCDLQAVYNQAAIDSGSEVAFIFSAGNASPQYTLLYNGEECNNNQFVVKPGKPGIISIVFDKNAETRKHYFQIIPVLSSVKNLERINNREPEQYELTLRARYIIVMNPLLLACIWLAVVIVALLIIWFIVLKRFLYPVFRSMHSLQVKSPYFSFKKICKARRIVFTARTKKQSFLSKIFQGKIIYEVNPVWSDELAIIPAKRGGKAVTGNKYRIMPFATVLSRHTNYTVEHLATRQKAEIALL